MEETCRKIPMCFVLCTLKIVSKEVPWFFGWWILSLALLVDHVFAEWKTTEL